jgi:Fur family zinc uptake transcriptional regulator
MEQDPIPTNGTTITMANNNAMVFEAIRSAAAVVTAYAILERLRPLHPRIEPPTIYRALSFLTEHGLVQRIESLNADVATDTHKAGPVLFAICNDCGRVDQRDAATDVKRIIRSLAEDGFMSTHPVIEMHGRCAPYEQAQHDGKKP